MLLRSGFLLFALLTAPVASTAPSSSVPVDYAARAKFPLATPRQVDAIALVNRAINDSIVSESDQKHYGVADLWVMMPPDNKGDCEDFALTKLFVLSQAGFPIVTNTKLVGVIVHTGKSEEGHAILAVRLDSGEVAYLDNMNAEPMTRRELVARGYEFFDWRA